MKNHMIITKIMYIDSNIRYGHPMSQPLPYEEIEFDTPDDSDIGNSVEVDLIYPDNIKQKILHFVQRIKKLIVIVLPHI